MALQNGIIIHQYLDDWLIRSQSKQVLLNQTEWLLALCKTLGLRINLEKSELTPTRDFIFVGYQYRTQINRVYPTQKRIEQIQQKVTVFLNAQALPARQWLSITGLLTATEKLVPMGRTHMRDLQYCLKRQWKQTETNLNQSVQIDHLARTELRWWYDTTNLIVGAPMHPPNPDIQIFTDSSMEGWGAHTLNLEVSGVWSPNERTLHINNLELRAVVLALKHWERVNCHWENNTKSLVASDNSTVVAYINKQGGTCSIKITVHGSKRNVDLVPSEGNNSPCKIYSRKAPCSSRSVEQEGANSPHRVVPLSQDFQTVMQPVHQAGPRIRSCRCPVRCITKSVRGSTNAIYNSKWGIFEAWCCKRKIDPVKVSIHRIADFLTEKREGGLSATTIEGYRSAISNTLKHTSGLDLGLDSYISALLRSFRLEDTKSRNPSPPWDLSLVLAVLRSKPFEPIRSISMKNLT